MDAQTVRGATEDTVWQATAIILATCAAAFLAAAFIPFGAAIAFAVGAVVCQYKVRRPFSPSFTNTKETVQP